MKIRFFGSLAETIGREVELPAANGRTVAEVRHMLVERHGHAAARLETPSVRACVGDRIVAEDFTPPPGAVLEFLPPLSGG